VEEAPNENVDLEEVDIGVSAVDEAPNETDPLVVEVTVPKEKVLLEESPLEVSSKPLSAGKPFLEESPKSNFTDGLDFLGTLIPPRRSGGPPVEDLPSEELETEVPLVGLEMLPKLNGVAVVTVLEVFKEGELVAGIVEDSDDTVI